jgi:hypothetical protein
LSLSIGLSRFKEGKTWYLSNHALSDIWILTDVAGEVFHDFNIGQTRWMSRKSVFSSSVQSFSESLRELELVNHLASKLVYQFSI